MPYRPDGPMTVSHDRDISDPSVRTLSGRDEDGLVLSIQTIDKGEVACRVDVRRRPVLRRRQP
jgi:hypothetical protein